METIEMKHNRIGVCLVASLGLTSVGLIVPSPLSAQEPKLQITLKGDTNWMDSVSYSPDGKTLASGSTDKTIRLWDVPAAKKADK